MTLKDDVLSKIDLQALAEKYGAKFNASHSSKCPIHKGDNPNGFHLYGENGHLDRWHCFTRCPDDNNDGNAIDLMMAMENVDFQTAFTELITMAGLDGRAPELPKRSPASALRPATIRQTNEPQSIWVKRAEEFVAYGQKQLWSPTSKPVLKWLIEQRGLSEQTIKQNELGYNADDVFDRPVRWGEQGKKIYCSMGVIIPHRADGKLRFVNVRRPLPDDSLTTAMNKCVTFAEDEKYAGPRGGRRGLYGIDHLQRLPIALMVEGEFDCLLARQLVGEIADVVTIGGARMKLDVLGAAALLSASIILSLYDEDATGDRGRAYLAEITDRVQTVRVPDHDLTDYWKHGGPLRAWLADQIAQRLEQLIRDVNAHEQPETFSKWQDIYSRALADSRPSVADDLTVLLTGLIANGKRLIRSANDNLTLA